MCILINYIHTFFGLHAPQKATTTSTLLQWRKKEDTNRNKPFFCLVHFQKVFLESASGSGKVYVPFISGPTIMNNRSLIYHYIIFPSRTLAKNAEVCQRNVEGLCFTTSNLFWSWSAIVQTTPTRVAASTDQKGQTLRHSTVSVLRGRPQPASRQHKDRKNAIAQPVSKYASSCHPMIVQGVASAIGCLKEHRKKNKINQIRIMQGL